ncbi:MAG: histidine kinase [Saprospiraceae bacterium]|nr:histidine kinase [Saprospiraceae bacterium]
MKHPLPAFIKNNWVELLIVPPVLLGVGYFMYGDSYFSSWGNFWRMTLPWVIFGIMASSACRWWRQVMLNRFEKTDDWWKRLIFSILGYLTFHFILISALYFLLIKSPLFEIGLSQDRFYIVVIVNFSTLIIITTFYEGITFFEKWKEAITEAEELEKLTLESQFRSLQSQLNPHFLFNSFNVLSSLISESPRRAEDFVDNLSNVYRYLLRSNEHELATVGEELRFIRSYFHLLATRHDTGILLETTVKKGGLDKKLPTLALQVLVENAVKHNEISPEKPLKIELLESGSVLLVRNNIQRKATRPQSNQVGLENLRQRYELLGVEGFGVKEDGKFFSVSLPMI